MDPHGAVGYLGIEKYIKTQTGNIEGIFLETAHPAKFKNIVDKTLDLDIPIPDTLMDCMRKEKKAKQIENDYEELKKVLLG